MASSIDSGLSSDPGHFSSPVLTAQVASACAIAISDFVQLPNEPEKSSIDVLSPRLSLKSFRFSVCEHLPTVGSAEFLEIKSGIYRKWSQLESAISAAQSKWPSAG